MFHSGNLETNCKDTNNFINKILPEKYRNKSNNMYLKENVNYLHQKNYLMMIILKNIQINQNVMKN